jgi:hypothetical protein
MGKQQNARDTRKNARYWDPYFKKSNVKKLKNLLNDALNKELKQVTIKNEKSGEEKTITLFELEQLIHSKEQDTFLKHYLSSTKPEDIVPWYKDGVELSLMYRDKDNNRYVDAAYANLSENQTEYIFNSNPSLEKYCTVSYTHNIFGADKKIHELDYQINIQKYPSNKVFVNKSGAIDLFSYNISYLYVGERLHNAQSNNSLNDIVPFVTNYKVNGKKASYYTTSEVYKNSFKSTIDDLNNKTGLIITNSATYLSYVKSVNNGDIKYLTLSSTVKTADNGEMWGFEGSQVYIVPQYSANFNSQRNNSEIITAYSQLGLMFSGNKCKTTHIEIDPYISGNGWYVINDSTKKNNDYVKVAKQYQKILKTKIDDEGHLSGDKLKGNVYVYTHPIACTLSTTNNDNVEIEYTYLANKIVLDVASNKNSRYLLYSYVVDLSENQEYDFSRSDYTYTYNGVKVNLCKYIISYSYSKAVETDDPENPIVTLLGSNTTYSNIVGLLEPTLFTDPIILKTKSSLINPITNSKIVLEKNDGTDIKDINLNFTFEPRSNPHLNVKNLKMTTKSVVDSTDSTQGTIEFNFKFDYNNSIISNSYSFEHDEDGIVYMFNHDENGWTYNKSIEITSCLFVYSYLFENGGIIENFNEDYSTFNSTFTYDTKLDNDLYVEYSYNISNDNTKLTKPKVNITSTPNYHVSYIGDKAIVYIKSDDFNIWGDNIKPFNTLDDSLYLVKNSYILCDSTVNEPLHLTYQHKSESNKEPEPFDIVTYNDGITTETAMHTGITFSDSATGISTHWLYEYDYVSETKNNTTTYNYTYIGLINEGTHTVELQCDTVSELIYKAIPNVILEALYNKFNVNTNINDGFYQFTDTLPYPYTDASEKIKSKYLLKPVFGISEPNNIKLNTINDLIYVDGNPYPLQSEYYVVKLDNEYYLYCIFGDPTNSPSEDMKQILPPLMYHINMFTEDTGLNNLDYEYYTTDKDATKVNLIRPINEKNTYMLYGFDKEFVNNIETVDGYCKSYYENRGISEDFKLAYEGITYCIFTCNYDLDVNKKLKEFRTEISNENYTYINKYIGFITNATPWDNDTKKMQYSSTITTAQRNKKPEFVAYVTTQFTNSDDQTVAPLFRFNMTDTNVIVEDSSIKVVPEIKTNYPKYVVPTSYNPILVPFTPSYD